jgi:hypothetical protein
VAAVGDMAEWLILAALVLLGGFVCYRLEAIHCELVSIRELLREAGAPIDRPGAAGGRDGRNC